MNMLVSSAAVAAAMPVAAEAAKIPSGLEHRAIFERAQQAVNWLRESFVCDGWKIDEARATASLAYLGRQAAGGPAEEEAEQAAIAFFGDHGQSLDWIFLGDPSGMVCGAAARSVVARQGAPLNALVDEFAAAENEFCRANKIVDEMDEERFKIQPAETLHIREDDTALGIEADSNDKYRRREGFYDMREVQRLREPLWWTYEKTDHPGGGYSFEARPFRPSPEAKARADEIIAAFDEWERKRNKKPRGYRAAERESHRTSARAGKLQDKIATSRASCFGDLVAKAKAATVMGHDFSQHVLSSIADDLLAMAEA